MTDTDKNAGLLRELKNVQFNAQNDELKQRAKEWLFESMQRIIDAMENRPAQAPRVEEVTVDQLIRVIDGAWDRHGSCSRQVLEERMLERWPNGLKIKITTIEQSLAQPEDAEIAEAIKSAPDFRDITAGGHWAYNHQEVIFDSLRAATQKREEKP
jgi:hypothetical protein